MRRLIFLALQVAKTTDVQNGLNFSFTDVLTFLSAATILEPVTDVVEGHVFGWDKIIFRFSRLLVLRSYLKQSDRVQVSIVVVFED